MFIRNIKLLSYCLTNHLTIKDFNELERVEYQKSNFKIWQAKII